MLWSGTIEGGGGVLWSWICFLGARVHAKSSRNYGARLPQPIFSIWMGIINDRRKVSNGDRRGGIVAAAIIIAAASLATNMASLYCLLPLHTTVQYHCSSIGGTRGTYDGFDQRQAAPTRRRADHRVYTPMSCCCYCYNNQFLVVHHALIYYYIPRTFFVCMMYIHDQSYLVPGTWYRTTKPSTFPGKLSATLSLP